MTNLNLHKKGEKNVIKILEKEYLSKVESIKENQHKSKLKKFISILMLKKKFIKEKYKQKHNLF